VWPDARQLHYCEFHINPYGPNQVFNPEAPLLLRDVFETRLNRGLNLFALDEMDHGYAPTHWQRRQFPEDVQDRISVIHDGVNAALCRPNPDAVFTLPAGRAFRFGDRLVTYVARNLEPIRGFPEFMRAMERLLAKDSRVEVAVVGGDELSYGRPHPSGRPWREVMLDEVDVDRARIHFLGKVPYDQYLRLLQVSAAHVYLTTPFILSWSSLEAMAMGCLLVASDTEPVREVVEDGVNGLLVDFFDSDAMADRIAACLSDPERFAPIRARARETILAKYALARCLPQQVRLVEGLEPAGTMTTRPQLSSLGRG
jgi:glycosyltransferase involved in cell wall biosynthesis